MSKCKLVAVVLALAMFFPICLLRSSASNDTGAIESGNGLALTPPMGWSSWNCFGANITETKIMQIADTMVSSGMRDAGYKYLNLDDGWMSMSRDSNGDLQADPQKFPHGIKYLADYIHGKGLKLGLYSSNGTKTCAGYPASLGYESRDAQKFAQWGVDYLKYDFCYNVPITNISPYTPDIDKITVAGKNYEAESGVLSGSASIVSSSACSGGRKVTKIGNSSGALTLNKVNVSSAGVYKMTVSYTNPDASRALYVSVNSKYGISFLLPGSGGDNAVATYNINVSLNAGSNSIQLFNPSNKYLSVKMQYKKMSDALRNTGRPIVFSICEWGSNEPWLWAKGIGNLWRTTGDIRDSWESMTNILEVNDKLADYAGPGGWNDPDMLEVGVGGCNITQYTTEFSMWCMEASPLIAGNDITTMNSYIKQILLNRDLIQIDQDSLGIQAKRYCFDGVHSVYVKPLSNGDTAVCLFNGNNVASTNTVSLDKIGLKANTSYIAEDLWSHTTSAVANTISASVKRYGVAVFRVRSKSSAQSVLNNRGQTSMGALTSGSLSITGTSALSVSGTSAASSSSSGNSSISSANAGSSGQSSSLGSIAKAANQAVQTAKSHPTLLITIIILIALLAAAGIFLLKKFVITRK